MANYAVRHKVKMRENCSRFIILGKFPPSVNNFHTLTGILLLIELIYSYPFFFKTADASFP